MMSMTKDYYELDPDGDVILVFTTADPDTANQAPGPNAVPNESTRPAQVTDGSVGRSSTSVAGTKVQKFEQLDNRMTDAPKATRVVKMRVSSKHLSLASPVFKKMLHGPWKEAQGLRLGYVEIEMDGQNMDAMLLLMKVIHGYGPDIPRNVTLAMVVKISTLADYYNCHEVIHLAVQLWIRPLQVGVMMNCDELAQWIWISWVFQLTNLFRYATNCAVTYSKGPISTIGLPIPQPVIDAIEKRREQGIKTTLDSLRRLVSELRDGRESCSFECDSFRLGALTKQLHEKGFLGPVDEGTIPSISLYQLNDFLVDIKSPAWREVTSKRRRNHDQHPGHPCTLQSLIKPILSNLTSHMRGYEYAEFKELP
ncbi:hypothetical protein Aspvir_002334 [Aspergillus viridinutans]|uniref:BTB domain-containing protein n=1 Tax=Aspergillus viridinutans TaxID=75553 RepID=A0A9P3CAG4_ASPVI|nr:uncharacterized protein Aspvir_002334 [Aspergillus viridinutans]GIK06684.1 hypothetical protein Aspvir_002334 [Aspergillus viridinutans]